MKQSKVQSLKSKVAIGCGGLSTLDVGRWTKQ